jgi:hypothetical protein
VSTSALNTAINQITPGNSQGYPLGLSWDTGIYGTRTLTPAPSGFSALTGWGVAYQEAGAPVSPNAASDTVQIANFTTYVHLTNGTWVKVQDSAQTGISGAHYLPDFSGNANAPWRQQTLSDGSVSVDAPQTGYNDHFWPVGRGTYAPGTVDGVFIEANMKTNDPSANLVAQIGADWWLNATAPYVSGFANNPVVGGGDFIKLTTQWQTAYYTSLSPQQLQADPPPGLQPDSTPPTQPAVTQVSASPATGIEHAGNTITMTLGFNEAVTVTGTPTLSLNDGGTATYVSGSGTSSLTFHTTVASTDTNTSALAITAVNLPTGASIKDASGLSANLSGAAKTFSGLQIDPTPLTTPPVTTPPVATPPVTTPPAIQPAVTQATASPGTGIEHVGDTVALTLGFNEAVTVTGKPTLTLNDGGIATYVGGSGTSKLTFETTVASTNTGTSALAVTAVNLAGGSIKDAGGLSANLSGAVKTFAGLQVDTTPTSAPAPSGPTKPVLSVADNTLSVNAGGKVDLGLDVSTTDKNDVVSVNIKGLPRYETITDHLDGHTFSGKDITLTAAQVESGLTLNSHYWGSHQPVATLAVTATAKDPVTGAVATSATRTITVKDPPATTAASGPTKPVLSVEDHTLSVNAGGKVDLGVDVSTTDKNDVVSVNIKGLPRYETITDHLDGHTFRGKDITLTAAQVESGLTLNSHYRGSHHPVATLAATATAKDPVTGAVATSATQTITVKDPPARTAATSPSHADHDFALLNQYLAGGRGDHGQIAMATSHASSWLNESLLTRPQH